MRGSSAGGAWWIAAALVWLPACTVHTALTPAERFAGLDEAAPAAALTARLGSTGGADGGGDFGGAVDWRPATAKDLAGSFTSVRIRGAASAFVRGMSYRFEPGGTYTASARIAGPERAREQTIAGVWRLEDGRLCLGNGSPPARARVCGDRLELATELGTVWLRR